MKYGNCRLKKPGCGRRQPLLAALSGQGARAGAHLRPRRAGVGCPQHAAPCQVHSGRGGQNQYHHRAGIEGAISQGVSAFGCGFQEAGIGLRGEGSPTGGSALLCHKWGGSDLNKNPVIQMVPSPLKVLTTALCKVTGGQYVPMDSDYDMGGSTVFGTERCVFCQK